MGDLPLLYWWTFLLCTLDICPTTYLSLTSQDSLLSEWGWVLVICERYCSQFTYFCMSLLWHKCGPQKPTAVLKMTVYNWGVIRNLWQGKKTHWEILWCMKLKWTPSELKIRPIMLLNYWKRILERGREGRIFFAAYKICVVQNFTETCEGFNIQFRCG